MERCYEIVGYPPGWKKKTNSYNNNVVYEKCESISGPSSLTSEQMQKILSLINEKPGLQSVNANVAGRFFNSNVFFNKHFDKNFNLYSCDKQPHFLKGWILDSGANQHMTLSEKSLENVVDVTDLNLKVGHPNVTEARINRIGILKLCNEIILINVLVVPTYLLVSYLFINWLEIANFMSLLMNTTATFRI